MNKIVDAIIPVYRPGNEFKELLRRLSNQSYPLNKIILMNTGDAPWRAEIEKEFPLCEIHLLKTLGQFSFLPVARKADDMTPVYREEDAYSQEEYSLIIQCHPFITGYNR